MADNFTRPDGVNIKQVKLSSLDGKKTYDLSGQTLSIDVYEDIMFPVIRAEIVIKDAIDLLTSFPIIGEELIEIEFETPGNDITCHYIFHVKSVDNQTIDAQHKSRTYTIRVISEEFITSAHQIISKKQTGNTDFLVTQLCNQYLNTQKTIAVEPTKGTQDILITRLRPLQAIDMLRKRAVSNKYISSSFVFFENKRGFNFCTIEFLLNQTQLNVNDKVFFYDTTGQTNVKNNTFRNMITLAQVSQVDNTKKLTQGGLNNTVKRFDLLTGDITTTTFKNSEKQSDFKFASKKPLGLNTSTFEKKFGNTNSTALLVPHSSHLPENYIDSYMGAKHAFITKMSQNIFQAHVNGDVALTAGDVITVNVPTPTGSTDASSDNRLYAGNYLISKLRHIILLNGSAQKSYTVSMELIKGFNEDYS